MRTIIYPLIFLGFVIMGCSNNPEAKIVKEENSDVIYESFGAEITSKNTSPASEFNGEILNKTIKLEGVVNKVCKKKGCWTTIGVANNEDMRVTFKDYGFFIPTNAEGKNIILEGIAYNDTVSVDMLRHFAEDEGQSEEEIASITEPEIKIAFEATGVLVEK